MLNLAACVNDFANGPGTVIEVENAPTVFINGQQGLGTFPNVEGALSVGPRRNQRLPWLGLALFALLSARAHSQHEDAAECRVYEEGPLTASDYKMAVPADDQGLDATTTTELRYHYNYRSRITPRRVTAWTTEIRVDAVVIPAKSWNELLQDKRLMDHEQGHFDLTYIAAMQARLHFAQQGRVSAVAATEEQAAEAIRKKIHEQMQAFSVKLFGIHLAYDQQTHHGLKRAEQQAERKKHRDQIEELSKQLAQPPASSDRSRATRGAR